MSVGYGYDWFINGCKHSKAKSKGKTRPNIATIGHANIAKENQIVRINSPHVPSLQFSSYINGNRYLLDHETFHPHYIALNFV